MKYILQYASILALLQGCTGGAGKEPVPKDIAGCYRMVIAQDTATLSLNRTGDSVSGNLNYHWNEKDHNNGTFAGRIQDDSLIVADYTFESEGLKSVRQVAFRIRTDTLLQAYGELRTNKDTARFRDVKLVVFDTKHPFVKGCN